MTIDVEPSLFVKTVDLEEAVEVLEERGRVVLCGPPGCGKTTLAHALLRRSRDQGFTPYIFTTVEQWHQHVAEGRKCVVLMDAVFGTVRLNQTQHRYWRTLLPSVLELTRTGRCRLIVTVYPHVLRELEIFDVRTDSPFVDGCSVVQVMQGVLDAKVKTSLVNFHLNKLSLEPETQRALVERILKKDVSGLAFPWCCHQLVVMWQIAEDPTHIFTLPCETYVPMLQQMVHDEEHGPLFAALLTLTMKNQGHFLLKPLNVGPALAQFGFSCFSADQLENCAFFLKGSVLAESGNKFSNRVFYDATGLTMGRSSRLLTLLKVCDAEFLVKYVCTREVSDMFSVLVGPDEEEVQVLMRRVYDEILGGHLPVVSQHPCLQGPKFLDMMKAFCQPQQTFSTRLMNPGQPSLHKLLTAVDPDHHLPLLYWSTLSQSPVLTQWCLTAMEDKNGFLPCLPQVLLALALFHPRSDRYQQMHSLIRHLNVSVAKTFQFPAHSVLLPLPRPQERVVGETAQVVQLLTDYENKKQELCYLNTPSLPIPARVVHVQLSEEGVTVRVADRRHWYLVLRLLTDMQVDQVDEYGHTLLRQAYDANAMEIVAFILKNQGLWCFSHPTFILDIVLAFISDCHNPVIWLFRFFCRVWRFERCVMFDVNGFDGDVAANVGFHNDESDEED